MKRIGTLVLGVCVAALTATAASAGAPPGSWYIAPSVNALWLDDARAADDDVGVTLAFGRTINENWDFELSVFGSDHDRAGDDSLELQGLALSTKRVFYREGRVNPFLSLGFGRLNTILKPGADEDEPHGAVWRRIADRSRCRPRRWQLDAAARRPGCAPRPVGQRQHFGGRGLRGRPGPAVQLGWHGGAPASGQRWRRRHRRFRQVSRHTRGNGSRFDRLSAAAGRRRRRSRQRERQVPRHAGRQEGRRRGLRDRRRRRCRRHSQQCRPVPQLARGFSRRTTSAAPSTASCCCRA